MIKEYKFRHLARDVILMLLVYFSLPFFFKAFADRPGEYPYDATVNDYLRGHSNTERARRNADDLRDIDIPSKSETVKACFRMKQRDGYVNETCERLLAERSRTLGIWRAIPECKDDCID